MNFMRKATRHGNELVACPRKAEHAKIEWRADDLKGTLGDALYDDEEAAA